MAKDAAPLVSGTAAAAAPPWIRHSGTNSVFNVTNGILWKLTVLLFVSMELIGYEFGIYNEFINQLIDYI